MSRGRPTTTDGERRGGIQPLGEAVRSFLRENGLDARGGKDRAVYAAWDAAVGTERSERARAVAFRRGELVVEVDTSALLHEMRGFTGEDLRARTNARLPEPLVRRLRFRLRPRS